MFKPLLLFVLINAGISFAQVHINVRHAVAPDTTWSVNAVSTLEEAFDSFWPDHLLIAQSWINAYTLIHPGVYDVAYGHNLTVISNSTVVIELEAWDLHPRTFEIQKPPRPPPTDGPNPPPSPPTDGPNPPSPPTDGPNPPPSASVEQLLKENMPRRPPTDEPNPPPPPPTDGPNPPPTDGPNPPPTDGPNPPSSVEQPLKDEEDPRTYWTIILNTAV